MAMRFDAISLKAWKSTQAKWARCLMHDKCDWRVCEICREMDRKYNLSDQCSHMCPLTASDWCRASVEYSRLHKDYCQCVSGVLDTDDWEHRVMNYLEWIGLEIEAMEGWQ